MLQIEIETVWRFHNAMTNALKGRNLTALPRRLGPSRCMT